MNALDDGGRLAVPILTGAGDGAIPGQDQHQGFAVLAVERGSDVDQSRRGESSPQVRPDLDGGRFVVGADAMRIDEDHVIGEGGRLRLGGPEMLGEQLLCLEAGRARREGVGIAVLAERRTKGSGDDQDRDDDQPDRQDWPAKPDHQPSERFHQGVVSASAQRASIAWPSGSSCLSPVAAKSAASRSSGGRRINSASRRSCSASETFPIAQGA